jgi:hypothetical protein
MPPPQGSGSRSVITPSRVIAGICLIIPFITTLWVGSYASVEPTFIGIPFFYWYQMLWVPLGTALTAVAYVLVRREQKARRQEHQGGDA